MKVLSLFDGISCARVALDRVEIEVEEYTASEIDKYAIRVSEKNYPDIIRMGDVRNCNFASGWYDLKPKEKSECYKFWLEQNNIKIRNTRIDK
jgi:site-specific DNA-cytosine methylase